MTDAEMQYLYNDWPRWMVLADVESVQVPDMAFPSPEHRQVWERYWGDPVTVEARKRFKERYQETADLVAIISRLEQYVNNRHTEFELAFQEEAHVPMFRLTQSLMNIDNKLVQGNAGE